MASPLTESQLASLSLEERMQLLELVWSSLRSANPPMPEWHERVIDDRLKRMEQDPQEGTPWSEVRELLRRKREANAESDS